MILETYLSTNIHIICWPDLRDSTANAEKTMTRRRPNSENKKVKDGDLVWPWGSYVVIFMILQATDQVTYVQSRFRTFHRIRRACAHGSSRLPSRVQTEPSRVHSESVWCHKSQSIHSNQTHPRAVRNPSGGCTLCGRAQCILTS